MEEEVRVIKRGKNYIQKPLTLLQSYQYYIKDIDKDSKYYIDYKTYRSICNIANKKIASQIIDEGAFFKLPYRLGTLRIKKNQINFDNLKPDYGLYHKSNKQFKNSYLNEHTANFYVRFHWTKAKDNLVKNKSAYSFIPTRHNKRYLSSLLKENGMNQMNKYFS